MSSLNELIKYIEEGRNIFLTGGAGVGKSYLLKEVLKRYPHRFGITSSTALSAIPLGGMTLHRFAEILPGQQPSPGLIRNHSQRLANAQGLVIEEVSMISGEMFELLNFKAKISRHNKEPFGGLQIIVIGDFYQLPPVKGTYAFESQAWKEANFKVLNLVEVKRQNDIDFINALNDVRLGRWNNHVKKIFQNKKADHKHLPLSLFSKNSKVSNLNNFVQKKRGKKVYTIKGSLKGTDKMAMRELVDGSRTPVELNLSYGDRVMITKNQPTYGDNDTRKKLDYVNGETGVFLGIEIQDSKRFKCKEDITVTHPMTGQEMDFHRGDPMPSLKASVRLDDGGHVDIPRYSWKGNSTGLDEMGRETYDAEYSQFPLTLAYAITVHKSQGQSIDDMLFDAHGVFAPQMTYVALSRGRDLEKLSLTNFDKNSIWVDSKIHEFYDSL